MPVSNNDLIRILHVQRDNSRAVKTKSDVSISNLHGILRSNKGKFDKTWNHKHGHTSRQPASKAFHSEGIAMLNRTRIEQKVTKTQNLKRNTPWNNGKWRSYQPYIEECLWCTKWINSVVSWNSSVGLNIIDPPHDKTNKVSVRPAKTQISLGIHPVWSESSLSA